MEKKILYDSPEAAQFRTDIKGWVSADGRFYGNDEHIARYAGCTHKKCECGGETEKSYTCCENCRAKNRAERYNKLPFKEWDGKEPICLYDGDEYFFDEDSLVDFLYENEFNGSDVMLVICEPVYHSFASGEDFADDAHEDYEPPDKLAKAIQELNKVIKELPPHSYMPGKTRTSYEYTYKPEP
jgi:hypothetical protein